MRLSINFLQIDPSYYSYIHPSFQPCIDPPTHHSINQSTNRSTIDRSIRRCREPAQNHRQQWPIVRSIRLASRQLLKQKLSAHLRGCKEGKEGKGRKAERQSGSSGCREGRRCCLRSEPIPPIVICLIGSYWFYATGHSSIRKLLTDWPAVTRQSTRWPGLDHTDHLLTEFSSNGQNWPGLETTDRRMPRLLRIPSQLTTSSAWPARYF